MKLIQSGAGSAFSGWTVSTDAYTEHDRRHAILRSFSNSGSGDSRITAESIRPVLEGFLRVAFPEHYPPERLLSRFVRLCDEKVGMADEILDPAAIQELREIAEYANRFHHDTNPAWQTEVVNDRALLGWVNRALAFAR